VFSPDEVFGLRRTALTHFNLIDSQKAEASKVSNKSVPQGVTS
jgi:hypothetical protein